jgi:hypothetical protein
MRQDRCERECGYNFTDAERGMACSHLAEHGGGNNLPCDILPQGQRKSPLHAGAHDRFQCRERSRLVPGLTMEELAIGWLETRPAVGGIIVGTRNADQSRGLQKLLNVSLDQSVLQALSDASDRLKNELGGDIDMWGQDRTRYTYNANFDSRNTGRSAATPRRCPLAPAT